MSGELAAGHFKAMKLILDSTALEALLALYPELTTEISQAVANNFANRYLKTLARDTDIAKEIKTCKEAVKKHIGEVVKQELGQVSVDYSGSIRAVSLSPVIRGAILKGVGDNLTTIIAEQVKAAVDAIPQESITAAVEKIVASEVNKRVKTQVEAKLAEIRAAAGA